MRGLYAIVDVGTLARAGVDPLAFARAVLTAKPAALQIRDKERTDVATVALVRAIAPLCRDAGVRCVCNDRPDVAIEAGADVVHLGQHDESPALVRRRAPALGIGISTHTPVQLEAALAERPDYVAYGPVFATASKRDPDPVVGLDGLRQASALARAAGVPLVAIGGITLDRAPEVAAIADCAAIIADLLRDGAEGVAARASALHRALGGSA